MILRAAGHDASAIEISSRPAQTLLAYLALHPNTAFRREMLAGLIWPDASESNARSNLRRALWRIRKAVGEQVGQDYFPADDLRLMFCPDPGCRIDAVIVGVKAGPSASTLEEQVAACGQTVMFSAAGIEIGYNETKTDHIARGGEYGWSGQRTDPYPGRSPARAPGGVVSSGS